MKNLHIFQPWLVCCGVTIWQCAMGAVQPTFQPKTKLETQLSCAHLHSRLNIAPETLRQTSEDRGVDFYEYLKRKTGYSLGKILSEKVFDAKFQMKDLGDIDLRDADAYAFVGGSGVDLRQHTPQDTIEFEVSAADVCFESNPSIVFYSQCPKSITESGPLVIQWWNCTRDVRIPVDLSDARKLLGLRMGKIGGGAR